jgi:hypothetical protein
MDLVRSDPVTWSTQIQVSHNQNMVVSLGPGIEPFTLGALSQGSGRVAAGYPLFGRWSTPLLGYSDRNGDGIIDKSEVLLGDTLVYYGAQEPNYTASLHTTFSLLRGSLTVSGDVSYEDGLTQNNGALKTATTRAANDPSAPESAQAAAAVTSSAGVLQWQTVSALRFTGLSVAYNVPRAVAQRLGARALTVALQGTNLGLWTNYRGKDPDVSSLVTDSSVQDGGVLPQPRTWQLRVSATY